MILSVIGEALQPFNFKYNAIKFTVVICNLSINRKDQNCLHIVL